METHVEHSAQPETSFKQKSKPAYDRTIFVGYLVLLISVGFYGLREYFDGTKRDDDLSIFFIHYILAFVFVGILFANRSIGLRKSWRRNNIHKTCILLKLFLVSAYALNRELPVFDESVTWQCVYLILTSVVMLSYNYFERLPQPINYIQNFLLGSAVVFYTYLTIYVANLYIAGAFGTILLGVGAHIFVPFFLLVAAIRLLVTTSKTSNLVWAVSGGAVTIAIAVAFISAWSSRVKYIDRIANQSVIHADTELPIWFKVGQVIKDDWISERILKSRLVYTTSNNHFQWDLFPVNRWDEKRKHDPLVFLASGFSDCTLSQDDRINILKAITDGRHRTLERLWPGDNLSTSYIVTDVDIYPELRIAYTEHYFNIRNNRLNDNWWVNSQEAIYTFQLPEGSVVTSLSLWVNGQEEKAILTSKQKATEAYTTIVGREKRDPSVVHWQEGNTVSVRVFPCTPDEERKFKLGITSPLIKSNGKIGYKNVTFKGPNPTSATQTTRVRFIGEPKNVDLPNGFEKNVRGDFLRESGYDSELTITMDAKPIETNQFSFGEYAYSISEAHPETEHVDFNGIYLDINNAWTDKEIDVIHELINNFKAYVYLDSDFVRLSNDNWNEIIDVLKKNNFSLFPFHHVENNTNAIVITKGKELSPYLRDVKQSKFAEGLSQYFASGRKVYVFNLEGGTSTYIKSLKELRAFHYAQGNAEKLVNILRSKSFPEVKESEDRIALHESTLIIERKSALGSRIKDNAPDHLARLFAYNNIMGEVGPNYFKDDFINAELVDEATTAYVVSPVSSLIVLETKEDYERFGIKDKDNSLHNATKDSSGAVPEPHEWALIIVFLVFILFHFRSKINLSMPRR